MKVEESDVAQNQGNLARIDSCMAIRRRPENCITPTVKAPHYKIGICDVQFQPCAS
jgi:hypothetical protein